MRHAGILLVEDHPLFTSGFVDMVDKLRPEWTVELASSSTEAVEIAGNAPPDLIIIDIFLPDQDGFALLKLLEGIAPDAPRLLISGREDGSIVSRARSSGAQGFVGKTSSPNDIIRCLDDLLDGRTSFPETDPLPAAPQLSSRQTEILELLAAGHGNKEIRYRLGIAERTVRAHLTDLFQQLGAQSRMQAVIRARALGLLE